MVSKIDLTLIAVAAMAAAIYTPIASMGIDRFNKCDAIQDSEAFANKKMFLSQTLTIALTIPATFLAYYLFDSISGPTKSGIPLLAVVAGVTGIIASVFTYQLQKADGCSEVDDDAKTFVALGITGSVMLTVGGLIMLAMRNKQRFYPVEPAATTQAIGAPPIKQA
jgi:hypothetical protein